MTLKNTFNSFMHELKKSFANKKISDDLHDTFVLFSYTLYSVILNFMITNITTVHYFIQTYFPLPKINSI